MMVIALLIGIFFILLFMAYNVDRWLHAIAKNQKNGFESIYEKMKGGENID